MRPFETLESFTTTKGQKLTLHRRERDYYLYLDGEELMTTRAFASEVGLAQLACRELAGAKRPRVLIGGLGLGFTLRAALAVLPPGAEVAVAEIFQAVVEWNRRYLAEPDRPLEDPRVRILVENVEGVLAGSGSGRWNAVMLDVDNGPSAWCLKSNRSLYDRQGLARIRRSLAPRGILAVWSSLEDPAFVKRLRRCGFSARTETLRARGRRGPRQSVILARVGPQAGC